jgi:hypothetical protein
MYVQKDMGIVQAMGGNGFLGKNTINSTKNK